MGTDIFYDRNNAVRLAAFGCRILLLLLEEEESDKEAESERGYLYKELEALTSLQEKLVLNKPRSKEEEDFLDAGYIGFWPICLSRQVTHVIDVLNRRVEVIDMRP
ncbi:uncharacterized protein FPOAC1_013529 [Fusarium poae]|uniref:Uncharacterized protein n=1 Tax=Fusarium poae TaxID=36050 RepID=A0A1B8A8J1_FUSPO|nr:uncharacterized protein FPOAC1_013529 [Fusarium poae]KAG8664749.1 hypothetical protein FPOAC1_013529 [Fusarium poae]OBS16778.1 hypothetical protein FPOA_12621 [Fusarium poae]